MTYDHVLSRAQRILAVDVEEPQEKNQNTDIETVYHSDLPF